MKYLRKNQRISLGFLSEPGMYSFLGGAPREGYCDACFTGRYPIAVSDEARSPQLVLFEVEGR